MMEVLKVEQFEFDDDYAIGGKYRVECADGGAVSGPGSDMLSETDNEIDALNMMFDLIDLHPDCYGSEPMSENGFGFRDLEDVGVLRSKLYRDVDFGDADALFEKYRQSIVYHVRGRGFDVNRPSQVVEALSDCDDALALQCLAIWGFKRYLTLSIPLTLEQFSMASDCFEDDGCDVNCVQVGYVDLEEFHKELFLRGPTASIHIIHDSDSERMLMSAVGTTELMVQLVANTPDTVEAFDALLGNKRYLEAEHFKKVTLHEFKGPKQVKASEDKIAAANQRLLEFVAVA